MKRHAALVAIAFVTLAPGTALGQTTLLVSGGLNRASMAVSGDDADEVGDISPVTRMWVGLAASVPVSEDWDLELGAGLSQKGFGVIFDDFGFDFEASFEIDYFEITAYAGKSLPVADRISVKLLVGPALAMRLSCRITAKTPEEEKTEDCDEDEWRETDLGLGGGVRLRIGLSEEVGLTVGAFYTLGLPDLDEDDDFDITIKSRALTLRAGLAFPIG
ncbi:MAG: outer membrane beta-barrel protein [Gemmatimonadota bacterium]|nr:outer membrane beta-barrel protein [Gemmatimonadota bacterium]